MPFDPSKPATNTALNSAELRNQLTSLKSLIDACPTTAALHTYVLANSAGAATAVSPLTLDPDDPPSAAQLLQVIYKLNELIAVLRRDPPS